MTISGTLLGMRDIMKRLSVTDVLGQGETRIELDVMVENFSGHSWRMTGQCG